MSDSPNLGDHSLDLPFEGQPESFVDLADGVVVGGLVVMAASVPVDGVGHMPALVFRFVTPTGNFLQPVIFVTDDDQMTKSKRLIAGAATAAIAQARSKR